MKRFFCFLTLAFAISCTSCQKVNGSNDNQKEEDSGFVVKGWNGEFVAGMADAYQYFLENNKMPASVKVEGLDYGRGKMMAASCQILKKIIAAPDTWQDEEVEFLYDVACPDNEKNNTLDTDEMSMEQFLVVIDNAYAFAEKNNVFPNYCTVNASHKDADGSEYDTKMVINAIFVTFARIFDYYVKNNELPETFNVWHSDFLRASSNCPITDNLVVSTVNEIIKGKTTDYDKAKAIFEYARDEWDYEGYNNTKYGAVKVIEGKQGNCCDMSHAIIAMSRAIGIPARYRHAQCQYSSSVIGHVMAEIYVDGQWYLCDATNNGNTFGNHESWKYMVTFNGRYNALPF